MSFKPSKKQIEKLKAYLRNGDNTKSVNKGIRNDSNRASSNK